MRDRVEYEWRLLILTLILCIAVLGLIGRIVYLGVIKHSFLLDQGNIRSVREISIHAHRGIITDRNGEPLAISVSVASVWVNPKTYNATISQENNLSQLLKLPLKTIKRKITAQKHREFVYLKRAIPLEQTEKIMALHIPGIFLEKGYKRYYPEGAAVAQVIGFTNIDDCGQEGIELAYDAWLRGIPGKTRVVKDRLGNTITNLDVINEPQQGRDLTLSIDRRIQYLAYNELKNAIEKHHAESGSVVVLAVKTGEVLAMANSPSYNPNNRTNVATSSLRNRAVTDLFEPGSTIKAFTIANALASGKYNEKSLVDTNPGVLKVEGNPHPIQDDNRRNNGVLTVKGVLQKSSNIGVAKITLSLPSDNLLQLLRNVGFGQSTQSGFPGEAVGFLPKTLRGRAFVLATLSFGYGISTTMLQLVEAYAVIASKGILRPVTFLKVDKLVSGQQVLSAKVSHKMLEMLEAVLDIGGTGRRAQIPGYRVAGKTGTAYIVSPKGGYYKDRYFATFLGVAPVSDPQLIVGVIVKNPKGLYHGSQVAAPVFVNIMNGALRILGIPLDNAENI
ncbi:MAG: penicillin-binding protein 2 [Coxiellaceae bacterium]|jgi:cell division protein FtsI (penicillin-binding protein 3)|nr:penicillin-binding protein 2 [Coxiellaceae bacterium]